MKPKTTFTDFLPEKFDSPERLPADAEEATHWQAANRAFWESSPMRYDWNQTIASDEGSKAFFDEIDNRFFAATKAVMPWKEVPFDNLIPFAALREKAVLEVGVGMGSHAALIAPRVGSYTGIDLTDYAVEMTIRRLRVLAISGEIKQMDAEDMKFPDASFDFVWSWGVIHHSSNTKKVLQEIYRVLRPSGMAVIMVYHRGWWNYYIVGGMIHGVLRGGLFRYGSLARVVQAVTDGALARYYSVRNWETLVGAFFNVKSIAITGNQADVFPIPPGRIKDLLMHLTPDAVSRFVLSRLRMGSFLISSLVKKQQN